MTTTGGMDAVLYVCATRPGQLRGLAEERAVEEGLRFAEKHSLCVTVQISDPYGEPNPCGRPGWLRVREMAERGEVGVVLTRWPNAVSPTPGLRHPELDHLVSHGVQLFFTWAPLNAMAGAGGAR
ncbi:hypothetical protein [Streptomyces sp. NPDC059080]|uniref:hypothetical protein n=1 Tax=Streptomyces sp. NPDC059080 TaxID=3346718 RepID=UPI0036CB56A7